ncbi:N-acetylglutamate synthase, CG3035 family [Mycolicibacterium sediminis]|uniref:N-acetyltransferase n=1 Tax=Mycolicibacterium sediminis TaxID=1286180 RepID=A0A7I7QN86_9MYCO|nr:N-acetyltransferase [Mycolicibacterium sediminis]
MLPPDGTRVSLRYRLPDGSVPPHTDVVGHLSSSGATIEVRTRRGEVVSVSAVDVLAIRVVPEQPVRTSQIRNTEQAAALAWPGSEQVWLDGWLLRFGGGQTRRANSAVPLEAWAGPGALAAITDWYAARGVPALIAVPDRLFRLPAGVAADGENVVMTAEPHAGAPTAGVVLSARPDTAWREVYHRDVSDDVLCAVVDGEVAFATVPGVAAGRGAVTTSPDGTRWVGLSAVHVAEEARRRGRGRAICEALLTWGAERGATRAYVQVLADNVAATSLYEAMGFRTQHRSRYVDASSL